MSALSIRTPYYLWLAYERMAQAHGNAHPGAQAALGRYWAAKVREGLGQGVVPSRNAKGPAAIAWHRALTIPGYCNRSYRAKGPTGLLDPAQHYLTPSP